MRALTIWQPWCSAIAAGAKQIETRGWATNYRGEVAIHAAKRWSGDQVAARSGMHDVELPEPLPLGSVVAVAKLSICVRMTSEWISRLAAREVALGHYGQGRFGWILLDVEQLSEPVPMRGRQGLWVPDEDEAAAINAARTTRARQA